MDRAGDGVSDGDGAVTLKVDSYGEAGAPDLVIVHGLFGSARNWGAIARRLADRRHVIVPDLRNHGESPQTTRHDYPALAADLAALIPGQADVVGHSMGGKAAMTLALQHPEKVRALVVADIAPVPYGHTQMPMIAAMRRVDPARVASRAEAMAALAVEDPAVAAFLLQSLDLRGGRWRLNLDTLAAEMPAIMGFPDLPGRFEGPTLFLSGALSDYVRPEHREAIRLRFPKARFARIPGAGHWLHADRPREFEAAIRAFLAAVTPA